MRILLLLPLLSYVLAFTAVPSDTKCARINGAKCPEIAIRREWRALTKPEQTTYLNAVKKIRTRVGDKPCAVDRLVQAHIHFSRKIHMAPCFLPWHRVFLLKYEDLLQEVNKSITQPFWQSTLDSQKPHFSPIFDKDAFGGDGNEDDFCVTKGNFAGYQVFEGDELRCLKRRFNCEDGTMDSFIGPEVVNSNLNNAVSFPQIAIFIEVTAHGPPHNNVGGDLRSMGSPNDPIFWLHHCWIDKLWWKWQTLKPQNMEAYTPFPRLRIPASAEDRLIYFSGYKVKQTFNIKSLCYDYEELGARKAILPPVKIPIPTNFVQAAATQNAQQKHAAEHFQKVQKRALEELKDKAKAPANATPAAKEKAATVVAATVEGAAIQSARAGKFIAPAVIVPVNDKIKVAPAPLNREDLNKKGTLRLLKLLAAKAPLPEWNKINGIPQDVSDKCFEESKNLTTKVNNIPGYVSPVAPWNNERLLVKIIANTKEPLKIVAVVNGTSIQTTVKKEEDPLKQAATLKESIKASVASDVVQKSPVQLYKALVDLIGPPTSKTPSATNPYAPRHAGEMGLLKQDAPKDPSKIKEVIEKKKAEGYAVNVVKPGGAAAKYAAQIVAELKETRAVLKKVEAEIAREVKQFGVEKIKEEIKKAAAETPAKENKGKSTDKDNKKGGDKGQAPDNKDGGKKGGDKKDGDKKKGGDYKA